MTDGSTHLLAHARHNGGCLMVPRFMGNEPDLLALHESGLIELDWTHCTNEFIAFFVVGFERIPQDFGESIEESYCS
jgi:hypothetical protein